MAPRRPVACWQLTAKSASLALLFAASAAVATSPEGTSVTKPDKYNCGHNWLEAVKAFLGGGWPEDKKEWCCKHRKVGCETKAAANDIQYDCHKGYEVREAWSEDKRTWCCDHEQLGCKTAAYDEEPYDCRLGLSHWQEKWSQAQKAWCCRFEGHGCSTTTTTEHYDCTSGLLMWQHRWSPRRQRWCCRHHGRGCPPTTTTTAPRVSGGAEELPELPLLTGATDDPAASTGQAMRTPEEGYNCSGDTAKWQTWPMGKQAKCCDYVRCPVGQRQVPPLAPLPQATVAPKTTKTTTTAATTVTTTMATVTTAATTTAAPVTTTTVTTATTTTTTGELFNCELGNANAPQGWEGWKKEWCCDQHGVGCPTSTTRTTGTLTLTTSSSKPYNCNEDVADPETWSPEKQKWCCKRELRGCTQCDSVCLVEGVPASCRNRIEWLKHHVGQECAHARHIVLEECPGCERCKVEDACPAIAHIEKRYDCEAGFAHWEAGWSRAKKDWCCHTYDRGCPPPTTVTTTTEPFDCTAGLDHWQHSWPSEKKAWCCKFKHLGCTGCDVLCSVEGFAARCRDRVGWLVKNDFHEKEDACARGHETVLDQCPACKACGVIDACPATGTTTSVPYDCRVGRAHWRHHWSEGKRSWCCRHADVGCSDAEDEQAALLGSFGAKRVSTAAATTTATTTFTSTTEESFDCQSGVLHWAEAWPQRKKEWCCSRYKLGCSSSSRSQSQPAAAPHKAVLALQWVARDALPEQQGETLLQGHSATAGSTEEMKRWCEDRSDCVGFAAQLSDGSRSLRWAPKKVGTGFNARTAAWTTDQPEGQVWRWYYIKQRAETAEASELAGKFEQLQHVPGSSTAWTLLGGKEVPFFILGGLGLLLTVLFAVRSASISFMGREDRFPVYVALQPAHGGAVRDSGQELPSSASFSSHVSFFE